MFALPHRKRWIWTVVLYAVCFLCLMPWPWSYLDKVSENTQFLAFIAIAALAFVGAAPLVKDNQTLAYKVHCTAAIICGVCSQLVLIFNQPWLLLLWLPWLYWFVFKTRNEIWQTQTFWAEMVCFGSTFVFLRNIGRVHISSYNLVEMCKGWQRPPRFSFRFPRSFLHPGSHLAEIVVDRICQHLRIPLRLGDIGVPQHLRHMLNGYILREHPCGERVACEV